MTTMAKAFERLQCMTTANLPLGELTRYQCPRSSDEDSQYPTCSPHVLDLPYSVRKWHLPNSAPLQYADYACTQGLPAAALLQGAMKDELMTAQLAAAQRKSGLKWCATCGYQRRICYACMQPRPRISSSDLGVPLHAGAFNVVDQSKLSVLQPWPSSRHPSPSHLCAFATRALYCASLTDERRSTMPACAMQPRS